MYDILPFPNITATNIEGLKAQTNDYLIQLKETLEFAITNISTDNLSQDLIGKLNALGADIEKNVEESADQLQQVSNNALSISDVINSSAFDYAVRSKIPNINFSVNFDTGNLEYTTS